MAEARLTISMDFELGWGAISNGRWRARERSGVYEWLRPAMRGLIAELDAREMPLTWAAVGAMARPGLPLDHLPARRRAEVARFVAEARESTRDGRDLIDLVAGACAGHEIASHGATHTRFDAPGLRAGARLAELRLAACALRAWGPAPDSLVFPENAAAGLDALPPGGIARARLAPLGWERRGLRGRIGRPPQSVPLREAGPRLVTGTLFLHWPPRDPGGLRRRLTLRRLRASLDHAVRHGGAVHFWLHPFNLAEVPGLGEALIALADRAARLRDAGRLRIETMRGETEGAARAVAGLREGKAPDARSARQIEVRAR